MVIVAIRKVGDNMKKNFMIVLVFALICFFTNVSRTKATPLVPVAGIGDGGSAPPSSDNCSAESGCVHYSGNKRIAGVRVTLVDKNGVRIPNTESVDYWNVTPTNGVSIAGTTYRSKYVNNGGVKSLMLDTEYSIKTSDPAHIGTVEWHESKDDYKGFYDQHDKIEKILEQIDISSKEKCVQTTPEFLKDLGYESLCDILYDSDCKENLKNMYILLEPVFYINFKKNDIILTGTEYARLISAYGDGKNSYQRSEGGIVFNLAGKAGYGAALSGMHLAVINSKDNINYEFNSAGKKYNLWQEGTRRYSDYDSYIHELAYGAGGLYKDKFPAGNSMQLVWLGAYVDDYCTDTPDCCIPCDPKFDDYIQKYNEQYPDKPITCGDCSSSTDVAIDVDETGLVCSPNCCVPCSLGLSGYEDKCDPDDCKNETIVATGLNNGLLVCEPNYTPQDCCDPNTDPDGCCYAEGQNICYQGGTYTYQEYMENFNMKEQCEYKEHCEFNPALDPEVELVECDDDNANNTSHFRDPIFNSENGEFREYNTYEKMKDLIDPDTGKIKDEIIKEIANPENMQNDNTFQAVARANDSQYSTEINEFCSMHCQELFDVVLPDNKPWVYAGRYFRWTIDGSEDEITKAVGTKICAVDINLNKVVDRYLDALLNAKLAAQNQYQFAYSIGDGKYASYGGVGAANATYVGCEKDAEGDAKNGIYFENAYIDGNIGMLQSTFFDNVKRHNGSAYATVECVYNQDPVWVRIDKYLTDQDVRKILYSKYYSFFNENGSFLHLAPLSFQLRNKNHPEWGYVLEKYDECPTVMTDRTLLKEYYLTPTNTIGSKNMVKNVSTPKESCNFVYDEYQKYIEGYAETIKTIYNELKTCYQVGNYIINMGVQLDYQTINTSYQYSSSKADIVPKENSEEDTNLNRDDNVISGSACITASDLCDSDENGDGYNDSYFHMNPNYSKLTSGLTCEDENRWLAGNKIPYNDPVKGDFSSEKTEYFGIDDYVSYPLSKDEKYDPKDIKMLYFNEYDYDNKTFYYDPRKDSENNDYSLNIVPEDGKYYFKFMNDDTNYWNTIYVSAISDEKIYTLDEKINACVCKDGYVMDIDDNGECNCKRMVSYIDFTGNSVNPTDSIYTENNNYSKITDGGSLTVEFMSGTGFYPISLKYWTLGSIDENEPTVGHFDSIALEPKYYKNLPDGKAMCEEGNDSTVCTYGDPGGKCRYYVSNEIIFEPDDIGNCDPGDDDCGKCDPDDEDCIPNIPDDVGECIVDGKPVDECKQLAGLGVIYRIIDLDNPFNDRNPGANWKDTQNINNRVDSDGQIVEGSKLYSSKIDPIYSITMSAADIKKIRRSSTGIDYTIGTVSFPNGSTKNGRSWFLRELIPNNFDEDSFSSLLDKEGGR